MRLLTNLKGNNGEGKNKAIEERRHEKEERQLKRNR